MSRYYFGLSFWNKINLVRVVNGQRGAFSSGRVSRGRVFHFIGCGPVLMTCLRLTWAFTWVLSSALREVSWHFFPDVPPHHNLAVPVPHLIHHFQCLQAGSIKNWWAIIFMSVVTMGFFLFLIYSSFRVINRRNTCIELAFIVWQESVFERKCI